MTSPIAAARRRWKNWVRAVEDRLAPGREDDGDGDDTFVAPGPGHWQLDRSHHSGGTTFIAQRLMTTGIERGGSEMFRSLGIPISSIEPAYVHGFLYVQMRSGLGSRVPRVLPPPSVIRNLFAATPLGRRCEATARQALRDRPWQRALDEWPARAKELIETNRSWQHFDLAHASDAELFAHSRSLYDHCQEGFVEHFQWHGVDLVPIGMLLVQGAKWGIPRDVLLDTLTGASDATAVPQRALDRIASAIVRDVGVGLVSRRSVTLDDIRHADTEIAALIDSFFERYGSTVVEGYDIDGRSLAEIPELVVQRVLESPPERVTAPPAFVAVARDDLGLDERQYAHFEYLVSEARRAVAVREEQGPLTIQWPVGLLRGALLEIGRRRVSAKRWDDVRLALELRAQELVTLGTLAEPSNAELVGRRAHRLAQRQMVPPDTLGSSVAPEPNPEWFTPAVAQMVELLLVTTAELGIRGTYDKATNAPSFEGHRNDDGSQIGMAADAEVDAAPVLSGSGIGTAVVTGIARVATSDDEAIGFVQPGEILVTHATSPAYNLILGQVGGLVTTSQGAMSHAAVLARELGLTAIVGVSHATEVLQSGDRVRLDPSVGTVELMAPGADQDFGLGRHDN